MDIIKDKGTRKLSLFKKAALAVLAVVAFSGYQLMQPSSNQKVAQSQVLFGTVQQGNLQVQVDGYGILRSDKQKLLTSLTVATVDEIVLKPGALVEPDSIILKLSNPELLQTVRQAEQILSQQIANLQQLRLNNQRDILAEESRLAELNADYEVAVFRLEGEEQLVAEGIVSKLDYTTSRLQKEQLAKRVEILKEQRQQLLKVHEESVKIQQEQINQAQNDLELAKNRVERLTARASMAGVLQELPVELGQSVAAGQALALIGSTDDLVALIRVPQTRAENVKLGQTAIVDTRRDKISGTVARIDPAVTDGTVLVEIQLTEELPASARPELTVNGTILTETLNDVLYIERPVAATENSRMSLFKLMPGGDTANATALTFGVENGRYIQIAAGAKEGDTFILSDTSRYDPQTELTIVD